MRSLAELTALMAAHPYKNYLAHDKRWEICGQCPITDCQQGRKDCAVRAHLNERRRIRRQSNAAEFNAKRRAWYWSHPEARQRHVASQAKYYQECKEVIIAKIQEYKKATPEKQKVWNRKSYLNKKQRKQQEEANVIAG